MRSLRRWLAVFVALVILLPTASAFAEESEKVVTLGANISENQKTRMLNLFGVGSSDEDVEFITVTNAEEREQLEGIAPLRQIGTRAISCAYVELRGEDSGVDVKTKNITWVTKETYANVLVTAGVKDAEVYAAAPFPVSGTAALTGLFKAYEKAKGKTISEEAKKVAAEEMMTTTELGDEVGDKDKVSELMAAVKQQVLEKGAKEPGEIRKIVVDMAGKLDVNLSQNQIDRIVSVMQKIQGLDIDVDALKSQLKDLQSKIENLIKSEQAKSWWEKIKQFFIDLWNQVESWF